MAAHETRRRLPVHVQADRSTRRGSGGCSPPVPPRPARSGGIAPSPPQTIQRLLRLRQ